MCLCAFWYDALRIQHYFRESSAENKKKKSLSIIMRYHQKIQITGYSKTKVTGLYSSKISGSEKTNLRNSSRLKDTKEGFPGGAVVENLPANAGDTGSSPGLGRSHMPRSNWAREPQLLSLCSATREAAIVRGPRTAMRSGPHSSQLEKALAHKRRPNTAKNKYK